jgi:hypothetical protein
MAIRTGRVTVRPLFTAMPALHILSLALVVACLSGINCYLTAFLAGLAGKLGWLPPEVSAFLSHPAVMSVALILYLLEALVDKIPAVDSLWDTLHTVIRPAVAVMLALHIMGSADPAYQALAGVLAGVAGLTTHLAKASARLLINNGPGPLANILVSIGEDLGVAGLFLLTVHHPVTGFTVCLALLVVLWLLFPRMFRAGRASLYLMWKKVRLPAGAMSDRVKLNAKITAEQDMLIHGELSGPCNVQWAVRCLTGRSRHFPRLSAHMFGVLVSVKEHPGSLVFVGRRWFRPRSARIPLAGCDVQLESGFLSENVVIYHKGEKRQMTFRFTRGEEALAARLEEELHSLRKRATVSPEESAVSAEEPVSAMAAGEPVAAVPFAMEPAPLFVESPGPAAPLPVTAFGQGPETIRPFPAADTTAPAEVAAAGSEPEIADVPPMPPLTDGGTPETAKA